MSEPGITCDKLLGGRIALRQPATGYRVAIDPVLLAAAVPARPGQRVLDAGAGVGAAALCLAIRVPNISVAGIEIRPELVDLARINAEENGFSDSVTFEAADILQSSLPYSIGGFDHVMANPPFFRADRANRTGNPDKARANVETTTTLADWIAFAGRMVRPRGTLTIIFGADRLDELLAAMNGRFGGTAVFPLWPGENGRPAKRVIVRASRGTSAPCTLCRGIVLHSDSGRYSDDAEAILRHATPLRFATTDP